MQERNGQPAGQPTPRTEPWPDGVIARYLTVAGATVDITHRLTVHNPPEPFATLAACTGCPVSDQFSHWVSSGSHANGTFKEERDVEQADDRAHAWAQAHAERCRALPRPAVTR